MVVLVPPNHPFHFWVFPLFSPSILGVLTLPLFLETHHMVSFIKMFPLLCKEFWKHAPRKNKKCVFPQKEPFSPYLQPTLPTESTCSLLIENWQTACRSVVTVGDKTSFAEWHGLDVNRPKTLVSETPQLQWVMARTTQELFLDEKFIHFWGGGMDGWYIIFR